MIIAIVIIICITILIAMNIAFSCRHNWKIMSEESWELNSGYTGKPVGTQYVTKLQCTKCGEISIHNVKARTGTS